MLGLLAAAIAGGIAGYYWKDNIREYLSAGVPELRKRAADRLGSLGEHADDALDRARTRLDTTVRSGQDRLRATGTAESQQAP